MIQLKKEKLSIKQSKNEKGAKGAFFVGIDIGDISSDDDDDEEEEEAAAAAAKKKKSR